MIGPAVCICASTEAAVMHSAAHALASVDLVIINGLDPTILTDSVRMLLLDLIGHIADVCLLRFIPLISEFVDRQTVFGFANLPDVFLDLAVREERGGLLRGRGRTGKCAGAHRDIREELRHLERIALLLQELIIESLFASLFGLLLDLTGTEHRLRALQASSLRTLPKTGERLRCTRAHAIALLSQLSLLLRRREALPELLLAEACKTLRLLAVDACQRLP